MGDVIYDATGANPLFPGDAVLVRDEAGLYQAQTRRVWFNFTTGVIEEHAQVIAVGDVRRVRRTVSPSQCLKTFVHQGMIWIPAGVFKEIQPAPGDEILAYSVKKHQWVYCGFVGEENGCCYRITLDKREFVLPVQACAVQVYPGLYERVTE